MSESAAPVVERLRAKRVPFAVIGAAAMSTRRFPRQTLDFDLLVTDRSVLEVAFWRGIDPRPEVRSGDSQDPLAGVARFRSQRVDVIVGRYRWQAEALDHAEELQIGGRSLPVVTLGDLILLKLHAGGYRDRVDVEMMLTGADEAVVEHVERVLPVLPADARRLWDEIRGSEGPR